PAIALLDALDGLARAVEPRDVESRFVANVERDAPELKKVRRGGEAEVEVEAVVESRHGLPIEDPEVAVVASDFPFDGLRADPAANASRASVPVGVAFDLVGEERGTVAFPKDRRALHAKTVGGLEKAAGVVAGKVESAPEDGVYVHERTRRLVVMVKAAVKRKRSNHSIAASEPTAARRPMGCDFRTSRAREMPRARRREIGPSERTTSIMNEARPWEKHRQTGAEAGDSGRG